MYLIFDTETTGRAINFNAPYTDLNNWPRCVQLAWQLHDEWGNLIEQQDFIIKPDGFDIPFNAESIHGISTEYALKNGVEMSVVLQKFNEALSKTKFIVGHNISFDTNVMGAEFLRYQVDTKMHELAALDTMVSSTKFCELPGGKGGGFKLPQLSELHQKLFGKAFKEAHNATADVEATSRCFLELIRLQVFTKEELQCNDIYLNDFNLKNTDIIQPIGLKHLNLKQESQKLKPKINSEKKDENTIVDLSEVTFNHLHNHTQYSILQSTTKITDLIAQASEYQMNSIGISDIGNMMGAFEFVTEVEKHNKKTGENIKPIIGCELFVCVDHNNKKQKDNGHLVPMFAKNKKGYHNLAKMSSIGYIDGFYYVPRIDKSILTQHKEDIIVTTGSIHGEIPHLILNVGLNQAEESLLWWKEQFGENFYIQLNRHGLNEEEKVNEVLLEFAQKHDIPYFAANDTYYLSKEDAISHDILLCVKEGEKKSTPIGKGRGFRFGFPNQEYYFKSQDEMKELFHDLPQAIINTQLIVDKIETYSLKQDVLLPKFDIPSEFLEKNDEKDNGKRGENAYLRHLTYEGAKSRWGENLSQEIIERLDFELATIEKTGYPGYFLIVQDFCKKARELGVSVGPGRGSAAGSAVAYCVGITNVDPIKYNLLFERFLNPDRVSLPDIDIDFDDEGRDKVIKYVIDKYGSSQVAQIITYGKMAAKSAIRDTARVLDLPLPDANLLAKLLPGVIPNKWNINRFLTEKEENIKKALRSDDFERIKDFIGYANSDKEKSKTIHQAKVVEGALRNIGIHACGVIITPSDIREHVPVSVSKDSTMWCTQFDNSVVESAGLLKMDFLGLKTLTIIKDTLKIIKARHQIDIDIEKIPIDDEKTFQLFQRGDTVAIFQYESPGMQKHLKALKPSVFADLIAMNALYRPGPIEYIPSFIKRKLGEEKIEYDIEECKEYLEETYGITVYQEQVMLLSQKLADFTKGEADVLRKAMGKKQRDVLDKMKPKFIEQASKKGLPSDKLEKIWKDWEAFAEYAFNKSHSTCYAWIAYQTAYLKANYPAEYMASVLSNNMNDIKQVSFFMDEAKRMNLAILGPDVNESYYKFSVNKGGAIRFGLGAIKGVGMAAVESIINERKNKGTFHSIFDFIKRIDLRTTNKKTIESLALAGGFDSFEFTRPQYFALDEKGQSFIETLIKFGNSFQSSQDAPPDLFGDLVSVEINEPSPPKTEEWGNLKQLSLEKEVVGVYISAHPLDEFEIEMKNFCNTNTSKINLKEIPLNKDVKFAGIVSEVNHLVTKTGKPYGQFIIEDYHESAKFMLFGQDYVKFKSFLEKDWFLFISGRFQHRFGNQEPKETEFKITQMELLSDVRDKLTKSITLQLDLQEIDEKLVNNIHTLVSNHQGKCRLKIAVEDIHENYVINFPSKKLMVSLSNDFIKELRKNNIQFKLN
jgi:DNA polymerase III subunit alpha